MNGFAVSGKVLAIQDGEKGRRTLVVSQPPGKDRDGNEMAKSVHFSLWGRSADVAKELAVGQPVYVSGKLESREWQGRHFADFRVEVLFATAEPPAKGTATHREETAPPPAGDDDPLPF